MASIASVFVDFVARTAGFQQGVQQAAASVKQAGSQMQDSNKETAAASDRMVSKMEAGALKIVAGSRLIMAVHREIMHVIDNVDKIPGVSAETIASVNDLRQSMSEARAVMDGWIASGIAKFSQFGQAVGAGLAMRINALRGTPDDGGILGKQNTPDQDAEIKDANFHDKVRAAVEKLSEARFKAALAAMTEGEKVDALLEKSQRYETFAKSSSLNTLQRLSAEDKAFQLTTEANAKLESLRKQSGDASRAAIQAKEKLDDSYRSTADKAKRLEQEIKGVNAALIQTREVMEKDPNNATNLQTRIELWKRLTVITGEYRGAVEKLQKPFREIANLVGNDLTTAFVDTFNGARDGFKKLGQSILQEIEKIIVRILIVKPLMASIGGLFGGGSGFFGSIGTAFTGYAGAMAGGGDIGAGQFALVGENGPELLAKPGTVVSSDKIAAAVGSSTGHGTTNVFIDATGADAGKISQLQAFVQALHMGFEKRSVAAVVAAKRAGGGTAAALA